MPNQKEGHWFDWVQKDYHLQPLMQKYRELEQARFIYYMGGHFNPVLLDDFLSVLDGIFDFRAPYLMLILGRFNEVYDNIVVSENAGKGGYIRDVSAFFKSSNDRFFSQEDGQDDDEEDYLDDAEYFTGKKPATKAEEEMAE